MSASEMPESYPSPGGPNQGPNLPFYNQQPAEQQAQQGAHEQDDSGRGQSPGRGGPQTEEMPDDPALRNHLNNMIGNFGAFAPMQQPYQHSNGGPSLPPGSVA